MQELEVRYPFVPIAAVPTQARGLGAFRSLFSRDPAAVVTEDAQLVRIQIGHVPSDLLRVRISSLSLSDTARWNTEYALREILASREARAAVRKFGLHSYPHVFNLIVQQPISWLPHLPRALRNITVGQALDEVASTFNGIVSYEVCPDGKAFDVDIDSVDGILGIVPDPPPEDRSR